LESLLLWDIITSVNFKILLTTENHREKCAHPMEDEEFDVVCKSANDFCYAGQHWMDIPSNNPGWYKNGKISSQKPL
jgi:hypothetical protein